MKKFTLFTLLFLMSFGITYAQHLKKDGTPDRRYKENKFLAPSNSSTTAPNTNLLNGIMLIHPVVLYFFYSVYLLEYKVNLKKLFFQIKKFKSKNSNQKILASIFVILYAILLGGW